MSKLAAISSFLGGVKNRYLQYKEERTLQEKFDVASRAKGLDGLELCYPAKGRLKRRRCCIEHKSCSTCI